MIDIVPEFGLLLIVIVGIAVITKILKQPIIIGYVLAGLFFAGYVKSNHLNDLMIAFTDLGIMVMLFLMGLEFDLKSLRYLGKEVFKATLIQSVLFFSIGYAITLPFNLSLIDRLHLAILLMLSSTLFTAKWIEDKHEIGNMHGKIVISTLIIQDIIAILAITIMGTISNDNVNLWMIPINAIALLVIAFISIRFLMNPFFRFVSKYSELMFITSLGVCFAFGEIAHLFDYSRTIGAFIGGVILGNTIYKTDIHGKLRNLTLFFNMIFFVGLGFQIKFDLDASLIILAAVYLIISIIAKLAITYISLRSQKYDIKTSFLSSTYLANLSEFGIIMAVASGDLISEKLLSLIILMVIASMIISSYIIKYDRKLLEILDRILKNKKRYNPDKESDSKIDAHIILFGYYEFGEEVIRQIHNMKKSCIVIDNDPEHVENAKRDNVNVMFDSPHSSDFFDHIIFKNPEVVISGRIDNTENKLIIKEMKRRYKSTVIVTAKDIKESLELYKAGADYVIYPSYINQQQLATLLKDFSSSKVLSKKMADMNNFNNKVNSRKDNKEIRRFDQDIIDYIERRRGTFRNNKK
ncbi:cation:proton antiporter [Candidatus Woesearchaeota archaeon]|nr:cation:proton antiporter [Candidatus Woesearchaeota archaeon]